MTRLHTFDEATFEALARSKVQDVSAAIIYYLSNGRNAWHSTWISQYLEGCMHTDLESAQRNAEHLRKQGSVFYIAELPALVFRSKSGMLVVTEINSNSPFSGYSVTAVSTHTADGRKKIKGALDCYVTPGAPMLGAALSFEYSSRFWTEQPPKENAVVVVACDNSVESPAPLGAAALQSRRSSLNGSRYPLGWHSIADRYSSADTTPVRAVAAVFRRRKSRVEHAKMRAARASAQ